MLAFILGGDLFSFRQFRRLQACLGFVDGPTLVRKVATQNPNHLACRPQRCIFWDIVQLTFGWIGSVTRDTGSI
jgi:hypothetical protein